MLDHSPKLAAAPAPNFALNGGEMGALIRAHDWGATELGPMEKWPLSLKLAMSLMLGNKFGMYIAWGENFIQLYNDGYRPILGTTKHPQALGNRAANTFSESWNIIRPLFENVRSGEAVGSEDWLLPLNRHGTLEDCYFTFSYSPIRHEDGKVGGVLVTVTETTARVHTEKALKIAVEKLGGAERNLQQLLAQAPVGIATVQGPDHIFTLANPAYTSLLFPGRTDLVGKPVREAIPEVVEQGFVQLLDNVLNTGVPFVGKEVPIRIRQQNGSDRQFFVNFVYQPVVGDNGRNTGILCVVYDVTNLVKAREDVEENETRYRTLTESLPQMMWTATPEGLVNYANQRCLEYTGFPSEKKYGDGWVAAIHPDDTSHVGEAWRKSMSTGELFQKEYRIRNAQGEYRWFLGRAVAVKRSDGTTENWIGTATDIDEQKTAIGNLELERNLREQFVATLTHDLRNPLTAGRLAAQLLTRNHGSPDKLTSLSGRIVDSLTRADQMIENLLDANRIKAGEMLLLAKEPTDLVALARETLADLSTVVGDRFVLKTEAAAIIGEWSPDALRRVLENLCTNAVKYGGPLPVTVRVELNGRNAWLEVHNFGTPIPHSEISHLFDPFKRATTSVAGKSKGWGLGLTLVKGFVEAHGGEVSVRSDAERGTTFRIVLPIA